MSVNYRELLQHTLKSVPEQQRLGFLQEVIATLSEESQKVLFQEALENQKRQAKTAAIKEKTDRVHHYRRKTDKPPVRQPAHVSPTTINQLMAQAEQEAIQFAENPGAHDQPNQNLEEEFKKIMAQHQPETEDDLKRQFISCLGLFFLGGIILLILSYAGGQLWFALKDMLFGVES